MKNYRMRVLAFAMCVVMLVPVGLVGAFAAEAPSSLVFLKNEKGTTGYYYADAAGNKIAEGETYLQQGVRKASTFPATYSSVKKGYVTPVRSQGNSSCCWSFAALSALETSAVKQGYGTADTTDYSEAHLIWFSGKSASQNQEDSMYLDGRNSADPYDDGNNWIHAGAVLSKGSGIAKESNYPFHTENNAAMGNYDESARYDHSEGYLTGNRLLTTPEAVKQAITENGSVTVSYNSDSDFCVNAGSWSKGVWHGTTCACYCNEENTANHMVLIVGWNDNYAVENFNANLRPAKPGAWLCKNSWTADRWGEDGYFWLSYEDKSACDFVVWDYSPVSFCDNIYQYDGFGWNAYNPYKGTVQQANVFTAQANQTLTSVGFYTASENVNIIAKVYTNVAAGANPENGTLLGNDSVTVAQKGYHTLDLSTPVMIDKGQRFSVVITMWVTEAGKKGTVNAPFEGESYDDVTVHCTAGTSYTKYDYDGGIWFDNVNREGYGNNCIKAYAKQRTDGVTLSAPKNTLERTESMQLSATLKGKAQGKQVTWSTNPQNIVGITATGSLTALAAGTVRVTATAGEYSDYVDLTVTPKKQNIKWYVDGTLTKEENVAEGTAFPAYNPTKEGHLFSGWTEGVPQSVPTQATVLHGTFSPKSYTVNWVINGVTTPQQVTFGTPIVKPADPQKKGHRFTGWDKAIPDVMPAQELTFTAQFSVNSYKLTWKTEAGETVQTVPYDTAIVTPKDPVKTGYRFLGWEGEIPALMPANDLTIQGTFAVNTYTLTWVADGVRTPQQIQYGAPVTPPNDPTKEGFLFIGWDKTVPSAMPAEDLTITARFAQPQVEIRGYTAQKNVDYKATVIFTATKEYAVNGEQVHWFVDGRDVATGDTYKAEKATASYSVQAKLIKDNEVVAESRTEQVNVNTGFFAKFVAFFKNLFGSLPVITQALQWLY